MGRVNVCGFSNLPIENGDTARLMIVQQQNCHNSPYSPFSLFKPVTPFVTADFNEDWGFTFEQDQDNLLTAYLARAGVMRGTDDDINFQLPEGMFTLAVRPACEEFWKRITYQEFDRYNTPEFHSPLSYAVEQKRKKIERMLPGEIGRARLFADMPLEDGEKAYGLSVFFATEISLGEGNDNPAVRGILKAIDDLVDPSVDDVKAVIEPFYDLYLMHGAYVLCRKVVVPIGSLGPQFHEPEQLDQLIAFLKEQADIIRPEPDED